jgi:hypothetical protein
LQAELEEKNWKGYAALGSDLLHEISRVHDAGAPYLAVLEVARAFAFYGDVFNMAVLRIRSPSRAPP